MLIVFKTQCNNYILKKRKEKMEIITFLNNRQKDLNTLIDLVLPLENKEDIKVQLIIPYNYPDSQCTLQIQNANMTSQTKRLD